MVKTISKKQQITAVSKDKKQTNWTHEKRDRRIKQEVTKGAHTDPEWVAGTHTEKTEDENRSYKIVQVIKK